MKMAFLRRGTALLLSLYSILSCGITYTVAGALSGDAGEVTASAEVREANEVTASAEVREANEVTANAEVREASEEVCEPALSEDVQVGSRILELLLGKNKKMPKTLMVGGDVFGVKIKQKYVTVTEARGIPALRAGDIILSVNGKEIDSCEEVRTIVAASRGESVTLRALHDGSEIKIEARPQLIDGEYRLGLSLRDGAVGIGTVTFVDPESGVFGGLGHGICDSESGEVIDMESGEVTGVLLSGVHKGECGKPGELSGILTDTHLGDLTSNCECGVFGVLKAGSFGGGDLLPVATRDEVTEGAATVVSTLKNGKKAEYAIEIFDVDRDSTGSKSFRIRATDPTLRALTGGIIRGMSGSPIVQNGKLVGAVTHVMVADPTEGYGIFIENMLNAANNANNSRQNAA